MSEVKAFDIVICQGDEVRHLVRATVEVSKDQSQLLLEHCEARIVPAGKYKVGDKFPRT